MRTDRLLVQAAPPGWQRSARFFLIALGLHAAILLSPLPNALGKLDFPPPSAVMVRLVEAVSPQPVEPAKIQPPPSQPAARPSRERPAPTPHPVMAMTPEQNTAPAAYTVPTPVSAPPAPHPPPAASPGPATFTAARFDAAYLHNPEPKYPPLSRRLGEEGKVLLKVRVSPDGLPAAVDVEKSSNFERLDETARQVVARWRFVPARRGDEAIEASVIVPVVFRLEN